MAASQQEIQQTKRMFTPKVVIIILVLVLLIAGMGVGGLIYFKSTADGEKKSGPDPEKLTTFSMGSLLVNLADPGGNNFMRLTPVLEYEENKENKKLAEELAKNKIVLQDTIIRAMRKKKLSDVEPPNSIDKVALELQTEINKKLSEGSIYRIYFAEYLTQ